MSEGRIVGSAVPIRLHEVVSGAIVIVAVDLIAVAGLEAVEDIVNEVEDLDGGLVGERRQRCCGKRSMNEQVPIPVDAIEESRA